MTDESPFGFANNLAGLGGAQSRSHGLARKSQDAPVEESRLKSV